ncbi:MAG: cytochrome c [Actinomycetota bacterium]|nr:cytochrome c [Actinomycetota bacterium]
MHRPRSRSLLIAFAAALLVAAPACGDDDDDGDAGLGEGASAAAQEGHGIILDRGCASCHGENGEGGIGPAWAGLFGTEEELDDGTTVLVDEDYIRRSIEDPGAQVVDGFSVSMPENGLTSEEIDAVIAYIRELS